MALPSGLRFVVYVCRARQRPLKHHNPMFEKKYNLLELFCLLIIEFYFKKRNFEDNISSKIEVSPKYG